MCDAINISPSQKNVINIDFCKVMWLHERQKTQTIKEVTQKAIYYTHLTIIFSHKSPQEKKKSVTTHHYTLGGELKDVKWDGRSLKILTWD